MPEIKIIISKKIVLNSYNRKILEQFNAPNDAIFSENKTLLYFCFVLNLAMLENYVAENRKFSIPRPCK